LEETQLHSTARRRYNDSLQPKLNSYFTYQTPDSAEKFTRTRQKKDLDVMRSTDMVTQSTANNGPHISRILSTVLLENNKCKISHHLRTPQVRRNN
jgi:hypothetical protein